VPDVAGTPGRLRGHRVWATLAQVTILADVVMHAVLAHAVSHQHALVRRIVSDPQSVTLAEANSADHAARVAGVLLLVLLVVGGIFLIVWLYRLRTDAEVFQPGQQQFGRGWAIGAWFVPLGNLVLPYLVFRDVIRATRTRPDGSTRGPALLPLTSVWWGLWVVGGIGARFVHLDTSGSLHQLDTTLHEVVALLVVEGLAGLLAIAVVEVLTRANRERWAARQPVLDRGWWR
jgi:Na+/proline symporter